MNTKIILFGFGLALVLSAVIPSALSNPSGGDWDNIPALSTGELLLKIKDNVVENGERSHDWSSDMSIYELDFISKNKYYYIEVMDFENDGIMDEIELKVVRGNTDLTDKWNVGEGVFERSCKLVPGRDQSILESKMFWDDKIDGNIEVYQFFSVLDYSNPATSDYDRGLINEKSVDERPNSIKDPKINRDFRGLVSEVYEKLIITPTITPTPTPISALVDSDGDGVPDKYDYAPYDPNIQTKSDILPEATPTPKPPGFDVILAIIGLLTITYLLRRRR